MTVGESKSWNMETGYLVYNLFLKLIVMMASSYISLPQSTKGWKFEDVINLMMM